MVRSWLFLAFLLAMLVATSCAKIAVMTAPKKMMSYERTGEAIKADEFFWNHFHAGDYQKIDEILFKLKAAYLANPRDWMTASHIAFTHAWRISEKSRLLSLPPSLTDDAELARFYFAEAHKLYPKDPRVLGFLADMTLISATIHHDEKKSREGYFLGLDAIRAWPEFNLFTIGYVMSTKDAESEHFKEGLEWQWQLLDLCAGEKIDRKNPDYSQYMKNEDQDRNVRKRSVCWNSWIAPHNFEGFFLNMGDMLQKAGEREKAMVIYSNARLAHDYEQWPYKHVLEQRLVFARTVREGIRNEYAPKPMMVESNFSCMACHQAR